MGRAASLARTLALVAVACTPLAHAQLDPDAVRAYGGRYAVDCTNPAAPRVIVSSQRAAERADARRAARWIAEVAGYDETPESRTRIGGEPYRVERACKPHDCFDDNLLVLYSPTHGAVYGKVLVKLRPTLIGRPSPVMQATLEHLWRAEFRQGQ